MPVAFNTAAKRVTKFSKPANTSAATIYTAPTGIVSATLEAVNICSGGTGAAATVVMNDGSTDYPLLSAKAISANTTETYEFGNPVMLAGYTVKVTDGTGNILTFTATIAEQYPTK